MTNNLGQVVHTRVPLFTKQYNLVLAKGRRCFAAGKVTIGLALHWPCVTDSVVYPPMGSMAREREISTSLMPLVGYSTLSTGVFHLGVMGVSPLHFAIKSGYFALP